MGLKTNDVTKSRKLWRFIRLCKPTKYISTEAKVCNNVQNQPFMTSLVYRLLLRVEKWETWN